VTDGDSKNGKVFHVYACERLPGISRHLPSPVTRPELPDTLESHNGVCQALRPSQALYALGSSLTMAPPSAGEPVLCDSLRDGFFTVRRLERKDGSA